MVGVLVAGLWLVLFAVAVLTAVLASRHRLALRLAMRNVRRGRARTALLIAGLLVGTTIITGSLVVGDTVQQLSVHYTYIGAGYVDEAIQAPSADGGFAFFPYAVYNATAANLSSDSAIREVAPEIVATASAYDRRSGIPETDLNLIGVNGNQSAALGPFVAENGSVVTGPGVGQVLLDAQAAEALNATTGDSVAVYGIGSAVLTVGAVVQENVRGGWITAGLTPGNVFVSLATAQALENASGEVNYLAITNTGSQSAGAAASATVSAGLNRTLASLLAADHLKVSTPLETALDQARSSSQSTLTIFLVLGLFSILAGVMLIVGIFVMLAEERKGEMGMLRAIGMRRRELVYTYYFEGTVYAAGSALAGVVAGVGVGYLMVYLVGLILPSEGISSSAILASFTVSSSSLLLAYVVGFLLTLVTVAVACRRASRLNIVRAIRDLPEPPPPTRTYTTLAFVGAAMVVAGGLGFEATRRGTTDISEPMIAFALALVGAGLVAARFVRNRYAFTALGVALLVWAGDESFRVSLLGSAHGGGVFDVLVIGLILVGGALLLVLWNADLIAAGLRWLLGPRVRQSAPVRVGLAYATRRPTRTAVSLAIFALVVFTMVATAAAGSTIQGSLNSSVQTESGGYSFFGVSQVPIPDLWSEIAANATLAPEFTSAVPMVSGAVDVGVPGYSTYRDSLYAAPTTASGPTDFYTTNGFTFAATLGGASAGATLTELASNASVAVVDESYAELTNAFATSASTHPKLTVGTAITLAPPGGAHPLSVTVIGILTESLVGGVWVNPAAASTLGYSNATAFFLRVAGGQSTATAAQDAKRAFFSDGLVLFDLRGLLASSIATTEEFIGLLEVFVGLGLGVGIAAMGIFALRAVAERRREIGMLRATGFTGAKVFRAFVLEYSFITLLGIGIGAGLGLLTIYNLTVSPVAAADGVENFVAPWTVIAEIAGIAYLLVLVSIAAPSLRAARLAPAEAVRALE